MSASRPQSAFQTTRKPFKWLGRPRFPAQDCLGSGRESCLAESCPSASRAWPPRAQGREDTGNLLDRVETRPPRAWPSPSDSPLCDPRRDKLRAARTSDRVRLLWSLPTVTDRGHRG